MDLLKKTYYLWLVKITFMSYMLSFQTRQNTKVTKVNSFITFRKALLKYVGLTKEKF